MGEVNNQTNKYLQNPSIFADVFNYYLYDGDQVILPESLHSAKNTALAIPFDESEEEIDMCKGMEDLLSQATEQGREQGREEGREEGRAYMRGMMDEVRQEGRTEGRMEGRTEGRMEGRFSAFLTTVRNLMETMSLTVDQAMEALKIPEEEREGIKLKLSAGSLPEN